MKPGYDGGCSGNRRPTFLAVVTLAATALAGCVQFADPGAKGSLMIYDRPVVPERYRGLWADRLESCGAVGDRGMQVQIFERMVGTARVTQVEGYSDHPAIVVTTDHPDPGQDRLFLDLSIDRQWMHLSFGHGTGETELRRCPDGSKR